MARPPAVLAKKVSRTPNVSPTFRALAFYAMDADGYGAKLTNGKHPEPTIIVLGAISNNVQGAIAESEALAAFNQGRGNDTAHIVISLESNRFLTDAEWKVAAETALDNLGMRGHIAIAAVHRNTENEHLHLVVNRVCPEPDDRGRYLLQISGGSVCSQTKDGKKRTNEVLSLHRAAAEIAIGQGWPLSENGRFGPDLQLRPQSNKLRLSQGSATAQALGKDSPELRTALAAQAAIGKARESAASGKPFWAEANRELADAGIAWKISEHTRKGKIVYGGRLRGEDGVNVKQSRLEDAYQIKTLIAEYGPPPAENAPAKLSKEDAVKAAAPILADGKDWAAIHASLGEHSMSLERKGQGAVILFNSGYGELKLSEIGREFTFGKLEKRLGTFQENANVPKQSTEKPARLPKGTAIMELSESRAAALYREARRDTYPTAYLALRGLTPAQIVAVGKAGEKIEGERRERAEARPTPAVKPIIKDHVLPRSLAEALDEIMIEMEQLARSQAAMRRIRAAVGAAEAAEAQARQMQAEAAKTLAWETKAKSNPQPENNDMFDFFKKKQEPKSEKIKTVLTEVPDPYHYDEMLTVRWPAWALKDPEDRTPAEREHEQQIDQQIKREEDSLRAKGWEDEKIRVVIGHRVGEILTEEGARLYTPEDRAADEAAMKAAARAYAATFDQSEKPGVAMTTLQRDLQASQDTRAVPSYVGKEKEDMTAAERDDWRISGIDTPTPGWVQKGDANLTESDRLRMEDYQNRLDAVAEALDSEGVSGSERDRRLFAAGESIFAEQIADEKADAPGLNVSLVLCDSPAAGADLLDLAQDDPMDGMGGPRL